MEERITNVQIEEFLKDFEENSETLLIEEGKEKNDLIAIAKAKGINLKGNQDLAGFKTIYTFADIANKNKARLPKKTLLKALPTMIGKPVNIDHQRRYVIGHYIDYRYRAKEDMVVAYGVFYKSNFGEEWEEAKKLFKKKKLATSYEIWCPDDKKRMLADGTFELLQQEIAGGALLYKEEPAFEDAKVLELAKQHSRIQPEDLIYAKKYKDSELIMCKDNICERVKCPITSDITTLKVEEKKEQPTNIITKITCLNCKEQFEYNGLGDVKCPRCFAILDRVGNMIYPPQLKDFKVLCPSCKVNRWLILSKCDKQVKIRCLHCSKEYKVTYEKRKANELLDKLEFVYTGSVNCYQCSKPLYFDGVSSVKVRTLKCNKCGLEFSYDISKESYKRISKIEEIIEPKTSEKGGDKTMEFKVETSKYHRFVDDFEKLRATLPNDYGESKEVEVAKRLTTEQRNALPDSMFAVVVRVKNKKTDKMRKIRMFPINDEAHVRNALARLGQPAPQATLKRLGVSIEKVRAKILRRARQLKMTELLKRYEKSSKEKMEKKEVKIKEEKVKSKVKEQPKPKETPKAEVIEPKAEETPKAKEAPKTEEKIEKAKAPKEETPVKKEQPKVEEKAKVKEPKVEKTEEKKPKKAEDHSGKKKDEKVETPKEEKKTEAKTEKVEEPKKETPKEEKTKPVEKAKEEKPEIAELLKKGINKLATLVISLRKEIKIVKEDSEKKIAFYKANAGEINKRRKDVGDYGKELSDEDILDDEKFATAKADKENAKIEKASAETVGTKGKDNDYYTRMRKEIDGQAFPKKV